MRFPLFVSAVLLAGCLNGSTGAQTTGGAGAAGGDTGSTTGDTDDSSDTGSSGDTSDTGTTGDTSDTGSTTGDTGSTTGDTSGATSTTGGTGSTGFTTFTQSTPLVSSGARVDLMHFAVIGDCRPTSYVNDPSQVAAKYPTAVISKIFTQIGGRDPQFVLFSGDMVYTYNPPDGGAAAAQIDQFLSARNTLDRPMAAALGNHEDTDASTVPVWKQKLGIPLTYYAFTVGTRFGDARFIVADDTFWDDRQLNQFIAGELQSPARYHIVLKHQPTDSSDNDESTWKTIIAAHPPTLILTGHSHLYDHPHPTELVLGTAGAPLANGASGYGYAMVDQFPDAGLRVSVYGSSSNSLLDAWSVP